MRASGSTTFLDERSLGQPAPQFTLPNLNVAGFLGPEEFPWGFPGQLFPLPRSKTRSGRTTNFMSAGPMVSRRMAEPCRRQHWRRSFGGHRRPRVPGKKQSKPLLQLLHSTETGGNKRLQGTNLPSGPARNTLQNYTTGPEQASRQPLFPWPTELFLSTRLQGARPRVSPTSRSKRKFPYPIRARPILPHLLCRNGNSGKSGRQRYFRGLIRPGRADLSECRRHTIHDVVVTERIRGHYVRLHLRPPTPPPPTTSDFTTCEVDRRSFLRRQREKSAIEATQRLTAKFPLKDTSYTIANGGLRRGTYLTARAKTRGLLPAKSPTGVGKIPCAITDSWLSHRPPINDGADTNPRGARSSTAIPQKIRAQYLPSGRQTDLRSPGNPGAYSGNAGMPSTCVAR